MAKSLVDKNGFIIEAPEYITGKSVIKKPTNTKKSTPTQKNNNKKGKK